VRVALVSSSYEPYAGGVEQHVRQVASALAARGVDVEVWTVDRGEHLGERMLDGIRVRYLPATLPARTGRAMWDFSRRVPGAWRAWSRARARFRPDLLHVHCFGPNGLYASALHRRYGVPLAITSHGETLGDDQRIFQRSDLLRRGLTAAISRSAFVTAPSDYVLDDLRQAYGLAGGDLVPNGVDLGVVPSGVVVEPRPYLLGVGRLGRVKGSDLLIDAFAASELPGDPVLLIGGEGPERRALEAHAAENGVATRVRFLGRLDPQGVADAMAGAVAVAIPSRSEAFGIVALESWRAGTALVMTSRGGGPSLIRDGEDGLLVDPEDRDAFALALQRVTEDPALRGGLAAAGRARVHEFSWDGVAEAYLQHYEALASPARK
jgi:glycogen(starch) synthase